MTYGRHYRLSFYCQDNMIDVIPLAFLYVFFGDGGMPEIDLSNVRSLHV
jgi:chitinase